MMSNAYISISRCLKSQERDRPHLNDVLKIISCYDRTRISIELLVSVVETVQDTTVKSLCKHIFCEVSSPSLCPAVIVILWFFRSLHLRGPLSWGMLGV